ISATYNSKLALFFYIIAIDVHGCVLYDLLLLIHNSSSFILSLINILIPNNFLYIEVLQTLTNFFISALLMLWCTYNFYYSKEESCVVKASFACKRVAYNGIALYVL